MTPLEFESFWGITARRRTVSPPLTLRCGQISAKQA